MRLDYDPLWDEQGQLRRGCTVREALAWLTKFGSHSAGENVCINGISYKLGNLTRVSVSEAHPGDMALFSDASHIGIIVGRNDAGKLLVCHCSSGRNNVVVSEFSATGFTVVGRPRFFS